MITIHQLLKAAVKQNASDLHLVAGMPPQLRISGKMVRVKADNLSAPDVKKICFSIINEEQANEFERVKELDFSFGIKDLARFRGNLFVQRGAVSGVFRRVPLDVPELESLGLPQACSEVSHLSSGLVLVTGPTGSGKSTTVAAIINQINEEKRGHILTIEDPIEFVHSHKNCIVNQREIGTDTDSFKAALKTILRQDPDYCMIGELRDYETIQSAFQISETGHLVFGTLHTSSSIQSISRLISVFPADQHSQARTQLSDTLKAVITQKLIPGKDGLSMFPAVEYLVVTPAMRNLIRENKMHQAYGLMQVGQEKTGMMTMNQSLLKLVLSRSVDVRTAFTFSNDPEELDKLMEKTGI